MSFTLFKSPLVAALGLGLAASAAMAGGYSGASGGHSPVATQEARAILSYADYYRDGNFRVRHQEAAGAEVSTGANGETAFGFGSSETNTQAAGGTTIWKRSVQRAKSDARNGHANATGFSASFVKIRTGDGKYYIYKGLTSAGASAGPGGTSTSRYGLAKSAGGRY